MTNKVMLTVDEARARIASGLPLLIAGDEQLLSELPRGNWIGGTIPYFIGDDGGLRTESLIYVAELGEALGEPCIRFYDCADLPRIATDAPENGLSLIIIPAGSEVHREYAERATSFEDFFLKPIIGWVSGVGLDQLGSVAPKVVNGVTGEVDSARAVVMHLTLPADKLARIEIVNLFETGDGDTISFPDNGFNITDCTVDGKTRNFAAYLTEKGIDTRLPLVADYHGAMVNSSFQSVDAGAGRVTCYAPVFKDVEYRIARPIADYASQFARAVPSNASAAIFSCNCILNYLYGDLEGKATGDVKGPITFGEIAYQLLNQTMVYVTIEDS